MKRVHKVLCFCIIFIGLFLALDHIFYDKSNTSQAWEFIQDSSSRDIDILFMGSSHAFTAINPVIINEALNINTLVLGSSAQPIQLTYVDLKTLLHYKKPKALVIEAFSLTRSVKGICDIKKEGYLYNDIDAIRNPYYRALAVGEVLDYTRWLEGFSQLFRPLMTWKRLIKFIHPKLIDADDDYSHILGFKPRTHLLNDKRINLKLLERKSIELKDSISNSKEIYIRHKNSFVYLEKIFELAKKENIKVFIIKTPVANLDEFDARILNEVRKIAKKYKNVKGVYNFNEEITSIGLNISDFHDSGHLNYIGATKFTVFLTKRIGNLINREPDYSKVCYYKDSSFKKLKNGKYRYIVNSFPNSLVKFIVRDHNKKLVFERPYSKKNFIDMNRVGFDNQLFFSVRPIDFYPNTVPVESVELKFIKDQGVLSDFSKQHLNVEVKNKQIKLENNYNKVPVRFAYFIYRNSTIISKQLYSDKKDYQYKFEKPGSYKIVAFIKTKGKGYDLKTVTLSPVIVDDNRIDLPK